MKVVACCQVFKDIIDLGRCSDAHVPSISKQLAINHKSRLSASVVCESAASFLSRFLGALLEHRMTPSKF